MITPVIMAGGSGTRLWPLSRSLYPKQFHELVGSNSMLVDTYARLRGIKEITRPTVICGEQHRFIVAQQMHEIMGNNEHPCLILEPQGRNTAPAVALSAFQAIKDEESDDPLLLILSADHMVRDVPAFQAAIKTAAELAGNGSLVTFGINPSRPETGYGYIRGGDDINEFARKVEQFVEKPNLEVAQAYVSSGGYYWNSGIFMFKAKTYLDELKKYRPDIYTACEKSMETVGVDYDFVRPDKESFLNCPAESIDYAVMEKTADAVVVPVSCGWSDVGSWSALWDVTDKDEKGNTILGDVIALDTHGSYIRSDGKLIATIGVEDLIVVESDDAILIAAKDRDQEVKQIVSLINEQGRDEAKLHRKVHRPWGYYDSIDMGERFQAKRIVVYPGEKLSLQMHHHRAEHWVVVSGTARVTNGDEVVLVSENESTYIPLGHTHRLENPGVIPLEMIEVQSGSYLGEDDIVRFDDTYGRTES